MAPGLRTDLPRLRRKMAAPRCAHHGWCPCSVAAPVYMPAGAAIAAVCEVLLERNRTFIMTVKAYGAHAGDQPLEALHIERRTPGAQDVQIRIAEARREN